MVLELQVVAGWAGAQPVTGRRFMELRMHNLINKTQKKSKLKIQDHTELESFRGVGERYREKHIGNNS